MTQTAQTTPSSEEEWERRLGTAATRAEALQASADDERRLRDSLVLAAIDSGWSRSTVARWAKVTPTRVTQIVAAEAADLAYRNGSSRAAS